MHSLVERKQLYWIVEYHMERTKEANRGKHQIEVANDFCRGEYSVLFTVQLVCHKILYRKCISQINENKSE
jgi:hypothetical protein